MRRWLELLFVLAVLPAAAFDLEGWLGIRAARWQAARKRAADCRAAASNGQEAAERLSLPVETWPDGSVKTIIEAERARLLLAEGLFWGAGVKVRSYERGGQVQAAIDADSCVFSRECRDGWAEGHSRASYGEELLLEGDGIYFSAADEYLTVASNVQVRVQGRTLTANRGDYDRKAGVALMNGRACLRAVENGSELEIRAERIFAFFAGTNQLKRIVALGGVSVTNELRSGWCDRAVWQERERMLTMYAGSARSAELRDGGRGDTVRGRRLRMWPDSEQVEVLQADIEVETGGAQLPLPGLTEGGADAR